jgi:ABC-type multidrug transport system ATPase subunit
MGDTAIIRTEGLDKRFGKLQAVSGLSLEVYPGEIYGFLGPNGAGKTTSMLLILGLLRPDAGRITLFGEPLRPGNRLRLCRRIGVMEEQPHLYKHMTAWEYLELFAGLYHVSPAGRRIGSLLERLGLYDRRHSFLRGFSRGMQQKICLARALLHDPELLLLDEPTAGLDPYGIKEVRDILSAERERGKTIFLSSHILSEIERTADRAGVLAHGRLQSQDTVANLIRRQQPGCVIEIELQRPQPAVAVRLRSLPFIQKLDEQGNRLIVTLPVQDGRDDRPELFAAVVAAGGAVIEMTAPRATLEEAFMTITDKEISAWEGGERADE